MDFSIRGSVTNSELWQKRRKSLRGTSPGGDAWKPPTQEQARRFGLCRAGAHRIAGGHGPNLILVPGDRFYSRRHTGRWQSDQIIPAVVHASDGTGRSGLRYAGSWVP